MSDNYPQIIHLNLPCALIFRVENKHVIARAERHGYPFTFAVEGGGDDRESALLDLKRAIEEQQEILTDMAGMVAKKIGGLK